MKWDRVRGRRRKGLEVFTFMCFVWINPFSFRTHTPQAVQWWAYYYYYYQLQPRRLLGLTHRQTFLGLRPDRPWSFWRDACSSVAARCLPQAERDTAWWGPEEGEVEVDLNDVWRKPRLAKDKCSIQFNFLTAVRRRLPCHFLAAAGVWRSLCGHTGPCSRAQGCSVTLPSPPACWGLPYLEPPDHVQTAFQHLAGESKSAFKDASHKNRLNYSFEFLSTKTHTLYRNGRYNKPHYDQNDLFCWFKQCNHVTNLKLTNEKRASIDVRSWRKKKKSAIEFQMIATNTGFSSLSKRFQGT